MNVVTKEVKRHMLK